MSVAVSKSCRVAVMGPPSAGKSTLTAEAFVHFRELGWPIELVSEYAREHIAAHRGIETSYEQAFLASEQARREEILAQSPGVVVLSDSPAQLNWIYAGLLNSKNGRKSYGEHNRQMMELLYKTFLRAQRDYDLVIFVEIPRVGPVGGADNLRIHTQSESRNLEILMRSVLALHGGADGIVSGDWDYRRRADYVIDKIRGLRE